MGVKRLLCVVAVLLSLNPLYAQQQRVFADNIRSLQLLVNDDPLPPPVIERGQTVTLEFDELSHDYHRFFYHIEHCNFDWTPTEGLFESDYLSGFNDRPIEDYENSFNTTQLYTHYRLSFPNGETSLRLSGNYRVSVYEDGDRSAPLLQAEFCVVEPTMSIVASVSGNTDIDFNQSHQQLSYSLAYGANRVVDPSRELHTVVMQNRRWDTRITDLRPNIQKATGIEYTHRHELIFPAGNEFRKFELLDVNRTGLNIDRIRWHEPYYHAMLYADSPLPHYVYEEDQDGAFVIRTDGDDWSTTSEYVWMHFTLKVPRQELPVYVYGHWANAFPNDDCLMEWNESGGQYEAAVYLKQGYYNYAYARADGTWLDGNFFQTENEYMILVYYRPQGSRYDRLVGYRCMKTRD